MKPWTTSLLLVALPGGVTLSTQYKPDHALRIDVESTLKMESTVEMLRDGQASERGGGGMSWETLRKEVHVDKVVEAKDGKPTKVHRSFEKVSGKTSSSRGGASDLESPLDGVTLEIKRGGDKVEVSAVEGKTPDAKCLEGHRPEIFLDGLLPEGDVKVDSSWDLEGEAIKRALRLDVVQALYPPAEREEQGGQEGGGRGRGGRMGGGAGAEFLQHADWKGKGKLISTDKDVDGKTCAVVELKIEASGDLPEPDIGGRRGGRSYDPETGAVSATKSTYEITLEGKLVFAIKEQRPVSLELEGTAKTDTSRESTRDEHTFKVHAATEGQLTFKVGVSEEGAKAEK
jgi:hypothetical protein